VSDKSAIEWTDATWNPTTGCDRVSPGCAHCYALDLAGRLKKMNAPAYQNDGDPRTSGPGFGFTVHRDRFEIPLRWTRPRRIFVNSMSDLFHEQMPVEYIHALFAVMGVARQHIFQVLTKRPQLMRAVLGNPSANYLIRSRGIDLLGSRWDGTPNQWPLPNVWLGTSIENNRWVHRADDLRATPAAVRFLSLEPLLGPLPDLDLTGIDWVIVGGESGPEHRPIDIEWVRDLRDRCATAGIAFFFKQWGGRTPKSGGRLLDWRTWDEMPERASAMVGARERCGPR
jgi:protein gp37